MADMEFWGVEVKAGQPVKCDPGFGRYLHLSQAALGEIKNDKGSASVPIHVKVDNQNLVIGTLSSDKCFQISFDLVFDREFELSQNWKHGSVYFFGYYTTIGEDTSEGFTDTDSDSEEDHPLTAAENGKYSEVNDAKSKPVVYKANSAKPESSDDKPKVKIEEPKKANGMDNEDVESDDDDESEEDMSDEDEDMVESGDYSDDDDKDEGLSDESSEADETTPKKVESSKRKPVESAFKTPIPEKKAKLVMPSGQKSGANVKKGGHTATPYPSKHVGKTPANDNRSKLQTTKSGGPVTCKSCSKTFNSDIALQSHTKAKHSAGK